MPILLYAIWIILNGRVTAEILWIGVVVVGFVMLTMVPLFGYRPKEELKVWRKLGLGLAYIGVLLWEILKANTKVALIILDRRRRVEQAVASVRIDLKTDFCKMILANSITLTPGTITASVEGQTFIVHCLSREMLDGIEDSTFVRLLKRMEAP